MLRSFSLSVVVILLVASGAFACIGRAEGFSINALNVVQRVGGAGWAESGNVVIIGLGNSAYATDTVSAQKESGILVQNAGTVGFGGSARIMQNASIAGRQGQIVLGVKPDGQVQRQSLNVGLENVIRTVSGIGRSTGTQSFVGSQRQVVVTPNGKAANYQVAGVAQFASVSAHPASNVVVVNTMDVKMGQSQAVTGSVATPKP